MPTPKKSFLLHANQSALFAMLSDDQAGKLIKMVFGYVNGQDQATDDIGVGVGYESIRAQIERDAIPVQRSPMPRTTQSALTIACDVDKKLAGDYKNLVDSLRDKVPREIWTAIKAFIEQHRPGFPEPYFDIWNLFAHKNGLAKITAIKSREDKLMTRIREKGFDYFEILKKISGSGFLLGGEGWKVDFDFVVDSEKNYTKILEGKYR